MNRVVFITIAALVFASCAGEQGASTTTTEEVQRVATKVSEARMMTIDQEEIFTSEVEAYRQNAIIPAASGVRVDKIFVEVGDRVVKDQLLATLDPTLYDQQLISLETLRADYNRLLPVFEAGGISAQTLDQMKSSLDIQSRVVDDMRLNIELRSPISGVVTLRNTERGNLLDGRAIVEVAQIDSLKVRVNISEIYYPVVKLGMWVGLSVDIFGDREFAGEVSLIYPTLDPLTRTFTVEVSVPNGDLTLRPGMHVRSTFNMGSRVALMVVDVAVQKQFGSAENYVYVVENGVARRRSVNKGRQVGDMVEITSGLNTGDKVVVTAFSRIGDGTALNY
ncbi:MAG: efflux RND transporter periplasmic adaptor subunit [Rikenellaceae bacterium]